MLIAAIALAAATLLACAPAAMASNGASKDEAVAMVKKGVAFIKTNGADKGYAEVSNKKGQFTTDQVDVGRSLAADRRQKAKTVAKPGQGDRGDQKRK